MSTKITAQTQNQVYNSLFDLMGTTSTGYGAVLIGDPVNIGDVVKPENWNNLHFDVERCLIHQTGTSTNEISFATTGTDIELSIPAKIYTEIQFLQQNVGTAHPSQLTELNYNSLTTSSEYWTCTNYSSTATMLAGQGYINSVNWSWFNPNQIDYFFNLGGKITPYIFIVKARSQERPSWQALADAANAMAVFDIEQYRLALENPAKTYTYVFTGDGDLPTSRGMKQRNVSKYSTTIHYMNRPTLFYGGKKFKDTKIYAGTALTITYRIVGSAIIGTYNFIAGMGKKKKGKKVKEGKKFFKKKIGRYIRISVQLQTDFTTTYPNGANGGIAAQMPQMQIVANSLSATPAPIPAFTTGVDDVTDAQDVILRNNSTYTCAISSIVLNGYTTGTVSPSSLTIAPHSSATISLQYSGYAPGRFTGMVDILCNVNKLTLFTEINVGSTEPKALSVSTTTYDVISQDFVVNHAGGYFKTFDAEFPPYDPSNGFTYTEHVGRTPDVFNITFDPDNLSNGLYSTEATVTVAPLDSSQDPTIWTVPVVINLNVENRHIADWQSCILAGDKKLALSYDVIGGRTFLTAAIGNSSSNLVELRSRHATFASWLEVYRVLLEDTTRKVYLKDYLVKEQEEFNFSEHFGVGTAEGSLLTLNYDGQRNLEIVMNTVRILPFNNSASVLDLSTAFRYYDSRRTNQLQSSSGLVQGKQTYLFTGFDRLGETQLSLVSPN